MPFRDVVGHRRLLDVLARSAHADTLPPSLIFGGPAGVGKRRVAVALAQALNCTRPAGSDRPELAASRRRGARAAFAERVEGGASAGRSERVEVDGSDRRFAMDGCGECPACRRIARGVHPDVILVEAGDSGTIKVEQARDVVERARYRPFEGRRRVVMFEEADAMVPAAQNALLKTLEEPPSASIFLLITSRPDALLATVRSRCPLLRFGPLTEDEVATVLMAEGKSETEARAVAAVADGSIGRALESEAGDLLEAREVAMRVLTRASSTPDPRRRLDVAKDLLEKTGAGGAGDREQLAVHLRAISTLLRDVALLSSGTHAASLANPDIRAEVQKLKEYAGDRGLRAFAAVDRALAALDRNAATKIVADWMVLQL